MQFTDIIGYSAALCTTGAFFPQAYKVYSTQQTGSISLGMFVLMAAGLSVWIVYGFLRNDMPVILANVVSLAAALYILVKKIQLDVLPARRGK